MPYSVSGIHYGLGGNANTQALLPVPFRYESSEDGTKLVLLKDNVVIATQSERGTFLATEVRTGVGSFHLADSHSISSNGQNVGFLNEFSEVEGQKILWSPCFQGLKQSGEVIDPTYRYMLDKVFLQRGLFPLPDAAAPEYRDYAFSIPTATEGYVTYSSEVIVKKYDVDVVYSWPILYKAFESGTEVLSMYLEKSAITLTPYDSLHYKLKWVFRYPFFINTGDTISVSLKDFNGTSIKCMAANSSATEPSRRIEIRPFRFFEIGWRGTPSTLVLTDSSVYVSAIPLVPEVNLKVKMVDSGAVLKITGKDGLTETTLAQFTSQSAGDVITCKLKIPPRYKSILLQRTSGTGNIEFDITG
jgi:hypothetical protein